MLGWIAILILVVIASLFVIVLRKQIFNKILFYVLIGVVVIFSGYKLMAMPQVSQEEAAKIGKDTVSPYMENRIYDNQLTTEIINDDKYAVTINFSNDGYAVVYIDTRSGEVLESKINNFNEEDVEIK